MFSMHLHFAAQIDSMKADLTKYFPEIKSSHRVEALARALGFNTYAALRSRDIFSSPVGEPFKVDVDWLAFSNYLKDKGFKPTAKPLYLAAGRASIMLILQVPGLEPNLTREGNGIAVRPGETRQEYIERFNRERMEMLSDASVEEFLRSYLFVTRIPHTRTVTTKRSAYYRLKHIAENLSFSYPDGEKSPAAHVRVGNLICAALHAGFYYKPIAGTQDVNFNMLTKAIDDLECEIRPNGALAQDRARELKRKKGTLAA